jgi:hypothetical protein
MFLRHILITVAYFFQGFCSLIKKSSLRLSMSVIDIPNVMWAIKWDLKCNSAESNHVIRNDIPLRTLYQLEMPEYRDIWVVAMATRNDHQLARAGCLMLLNERQTGEVTR